MNKVTPLFLTAFVFVLFTPVCKATLEEEEDLKHRRAPIKTGNTYIKSGNNSSSWRKPSFGEVMGIDCSYEMTPLSGWYDPYTGMERLEPFNDKPPENNISSFAKRYANYNLSHGGCSHGSEEH